MAWDKGFDFRSSSGYVTDPTNCTYVLTSDSYTGSVIRNGVAFGYLGGSIVNAADRNSGIDARLAGIHFSAPGQTASLRIDVPAAGDYDIRIGLGDTSSQGATAVCKILDGPGGSALITLSVSIDANQWWDASGVERTSAANWVSGNVAQRVTLSGTSLVVELGSGASTYTTLSHVFVSQVVTSGATLDAGSGSVAITGTAATLTAQRRVSATSGSVAITGTAATLSPARRVQAGSGSFSITGTAATLKPAYRLSSASGSFVISGTAAALAHGPTTRLDASAGSVTISGTAATFRLGHAVAAGSGSFAVSGTAATPSPQRRLPCAAGSYLITGTAATLTSSGGSLVYTFHLIAERLSRD